MMAVRKHKYQIVVDMVRAGVPRKEIAARMGTEVHAVQSCIRYARAHGIVVRFDPEHARFGYIPLQIRKWLKSQAPAGSTIEDMIVAILNDAYDEDTKNES
jgi:DNA-binding transcriptional regulator LsrR (DeoR family)